MSDLTDTSDDLGALAATLDRVVLSVPGVLGIAAAEPALLRAAKETVGVIFGAPAQGSRVSVRRAKGAVSVEANIAVDADQSSPVVAQAVHRAIVELLPAASAADAAHAVTVRVIDVVPGGSQD